MRMSNKNNNKPALTPKQLQESLNTIDEANQVISVDTANVKLIGTIEGLLIDMADSAQPFPFGGSLLELKLP